MFRHRLWIVVIMAGGALPLARAEDPAGNRAQPKPDQVELSDRQQRISRDYERFERALFDVAEQSRRKDPERAELLYRARSQSQEQNILAEMRTITELLRTRGPDGSTVDAQFGSASDREKEVIARLQIVLKLLQSMDDRQKITAEIERIQALLKETNRLTARQKDVRAETQRGRPSQTLKEAQERVADEAKKLGEKIDQQDAERLQDQPAKESGKEPNPSSQQPSENGQPQSESPDSKENKPADSPGNKQSGGSPSPQSPPPGASPPQQSQQSPPSKSTPGREELEQARREMQQAIEQLEKDNKSKAIEEQDEAVAKLEQMKSKLEEILRQLREEEKESYLTLLEARFQNMLKRQQRINFETTRLNGIAEVDRPQQNYASQTDTIRKEQEDNALDAEKALHLLKEEGSSVAFPEAVDQMQKNMRVVATRLSSQNTGETTQKIEELIVQTLEEMIAALRQELEQNQKKKQNPPQGQPGSPEDQALINQIAELKLIRSLQNQVRVMTRQIGTELDNTGGADPATIELIRDLEVRERRIQNATDDLSVGRNK